MLDNWDSGGLHGLAWCAASNRTGYNASEEQNARDNRVGKTMAQEVAHEFGVVCNTFQPCDNYPHADTGHIDSADIGFDLRRAHQCGAPCFNLWNARST
jgi:hypothetical protein